MVGVSSDLFEKQFFSPMHSTRDVVFHFYQVRCHIEQAIDHFYLRCFLSFTDETI